MHDRGALDAGSDRGRRDGAVRREVRRQGPRRQRARASAWSCAAARTSRATGDIGFFVIVAESGVAAGVRRIEALTGAGAVAWAQHQRATLRGVVDALHVTDDQAVEAIEKLQAESKRLAREVTQLKTKLAMGGGGGGRRGDDTVEVAGVKLARRKVSDLDKDALRGLADSLKAQDQERRRRHRVGQRRQGADRRRGDARPDRRASRPARS